jgi:hypothetical protein
MHTNCNSKIDKVETNVDVARLECQEQLGS